MIEPTQLAAWRAQAQEDKERATEQDATAFINSTFDAMYGWLPDATPQQSFEDRLKQLLRINEKR